MKSLLSILISVGFSTVLWGNGISSYPLGVQKKYVAADLTSVLFNGKGMGLQARYIQQLRAELIIEGGFGFSNGDQAYQVFVSGDYELYPDFMNQPKVSLQGTLVRAQKFNSSHTRISLAPVASKGLSFWGSEGFPFLAFPMTLDLNNDAKNYDIAYQMSVGASVPMPFAGYEKFLANFKLNMNIENAPTEISLGFSHPLN